MLGCEIGAPTEMEMNQLQESIRLNSQDVARKQKLIDSADPALIEAGTQALQIMRGQEASTLAPIRNQRAQDRKNLEASLAQSLGPDYATSSAGIQALNQFDQQTSNLLTNANQQTLGQFLGVAQNTANMGSVQNNINNGLSIAGARGNINARQANAITGNKIDPSLAFAGDMTRAKNQQQLFNTALNLGTQVATSGALSGGGGVAGGSAAPVASGSSGGSYVAANYTMPTFGAR